MAKRFSRREFVRRSSLAGLGLSRFGRFSSGALGGAGTPGADSLRTSFLKPPDDARIMFRWWWFGPAVTQEELEREMRAMRAAGAGGFEIQPVYPLSLDDPSKGIRNLPYLSDDFLDALRFVSGKARELGLRLDLTLGSGWPYGGPKVPLTQAAGRLRVARVPIADGDKSVPAPSLEAGESLIAAWAIRDEKNLTGEGVHELSDLGGPRVPLSDATGAKLVLFFISSRTGQQVKRAAVGAEGFVVDHYDRAAVTAYLDFTGSRLMQAFGSNPPYAVFSDSLEVFASNWTPSLLSEFRRRRGYDLKPHLLALAGDAGPSTDAVRCDWGRTLTELADENYLVTLREWADRHGTRLRCQTYGEPPVTLSSNRLLDLPEGEDPDWRGLSAVRWASSACHLYGKPVTSAETWTWIHSPAFRATPLDLKVEADRHFLQGVNQIVGHGWPYSPPSVGEPGWAFYAAGALNDHNPWWLVMPELALYLQRLSFLLRQGKPANDVAIYLSNPDAWARFTAERSPSVNQTLAELLNRTVIENVLDAGFNFDFIDDEAILHVGIPYHAVVLPSVERIPLATYGRLRDFAQSGGVLIATGRQPGLAPGLLEGERDGAQLKALSRELFGSPGAAGILLSDESHLGKVLATKLTPDIDLSPKVPEIGFIHRKLESAEVYFLANTGNRPQSVRITFRVKNLKPERWDPFAGKTLPLEWKRTSDGRITVALNFEPYESTVIVFSASAADGPTALDEAKPRYTPLDLSADWNVTFPEIGKTLQMQRLHSWTEHEDLRYYSGRAIYEKKVNIPGSWASGAKVIVLNFGPGVPVEPTPRARGLRAWLDCPVREAAVVEVNGQRAGSVWHPPYEIELRPRVRRGENMLRITVANLAINRLAGEARPDYRLLNSRYGRRFSPQDLENIEPLPSGLLGPVTLIAR